MPIHHDDEIPTLEAAELASVTGGAGFDIASMLPVLLMLKGRGAEAAPPPPPAPAPAWTPKVLINGVEQTGTPSATGTTFTTPTPT